jgi:hypothetical protein
MARNPIIGNRLARLNGQRAPFQTAEFAEREIGSVGTRQHRPRFCEEDAAGLRQLDAAPDPIEKLRIMPRLQGCDSVARSGLREIQRACGVRDVLSLRHRHENTKLLQSHIDLHASGMNGRRNNQSD